MTTTETPPPPIPLDERLIADMPFDGGAGTRALLTRCNVTKAFEIELLGCTGAAGAGLALDEIMNLRIGLGGGGVGLPCFVSPNRFCLAHNTIGGLQREQESRHPANVAAISRELTPQEAGQVMFTETVRRTGKGGVGEQMAAAAGALGGFGELPRGVEMVEDGEPSPIPERERDERLRAYEDRMGIGVEAAATMQREDAESAEDFRRRLFAKIRTPVFTCPEHTKLNWSCRFCVAQAITEGELDTTFAVHLPHVPEDAEELKVIVNLTAEALEEGIANADEHDEPSVEIYALVKTLTRKLA